MSQNSYFNMLNSHSNPHILNTHLTGKTEGDLCLSIFIGCYNSYHCVKNCCVHRNWIGNLGIGFWANGCNGTRKLSVHLGSYRWQSHRQKSTETLSQKYPEHHVAIVIYFHILMSHTHNNSFETYDAKNTTNSSCVL